MVAAFEFPREHDSIFATFGATDDEIFVVDFCFSSTAKGSMVPEGSGLGWTFVVVDWATGVEKLVHFKYYKFQ